MKKNYVLDTNVLLHTHTPSSDSRQQRHHPIYVIEEWKSVQREGSERGRNARSIARVLDECASGRFAVQRGDLDSGGRCASPYLQAPGASGAIDHTRWIQAILQTAFDVRENDGGRRRCS